MSEQFEGERCPDCGYPDGHSLDCPKGQRSREIQNTTLNDELPDYFNYKEWTKKPRRIKEDLLMKHKVAKGRLDFGEAQEEAKITREKAATLKAHRDVEQLTGEMNELGFDKPLQAEKDLAGTLRREQILKGKTEQPIAEDYDSGMAQAERDKEGLERVQEKLKRVK